MWSNHCLDIPEEGERSESNNSRHIDNDKDAMKATVIEYSPVQHVAKLNPEVILYYALLRWIIFCDTVPTSIMFILVGP